MSPSAIRSTEPGAARLVSQSTGKRRTPVAAIVAVAAACAFSLSASGQNWGAHMMDWSEMGGMMWGAGVLWLLLIVLAVLGVVALMKYLFRG